MQSKKDNDVQIGNDFSVKRFLEDQWIAEEEYHRTHFRDGSLRYEFRGVEDRLKNCGKYISMYIGADGTQKEKREFRCKLPECEKCMQIRENQRSGDFKDRLDAVADRTLFHLRVESDVAQKRLREYTYRHGYQYLSVPNESGEKEVFVDGPVNGSDPINHFDAKEIVSSLGRVMFLDKSKKVSGKLGKDQEKESKRSHVEAPNFVSVFIREYDFIGKRPSKAEIEIANVKSMTASSDELGQDGFITEGNVQAVMTKREDAVFSIYSGMGYRLSVFNPVERTYDLNAMNRVWARVEIGQHKFYGNMGALNQFSKMLVSMAIDEHNSKETAESFHSDVDNASSFFTIE